MKKLLRFNCFILTILFYSCVAEDISDKQIYIYKSETINFTELINNKVGKALSQKGNIDKYIYFEFETTFDIPEGLNVAELDNFISANQTLISGTIKYYINNDDFVHIEIMNGTQVSYNNKKHLSRTNDEYPKKDECSYDGIQDCVQYAVYEQWSTYTALKCSFTGGLGCIADEAASCIEKNCF